MGKQKPGRANPEMVPNHKLIPSKLDCEWCPPLPWPAVFVPTGIFGHSFGCWRMMENLSTGVSSLERHQDLNWSQSFHEPPGFQEESFWWSELPGYVITDCFSDLLLHRAVISPTHLPSAASQGAVPARGPPLRRPPEQDTTLLPEAFTLSYNCKILGHEADRPDLTVLCHDHTTQANTQVQDSDGQVIPAVIQSCQLPVPWMERRDGSSDHLLLRSVLDVPCLCRERETGSSGQETVWIIHCCPDQWAMTGPNRSLGF